MKEKRTAVRSLVERRERGHHYHIEGDARRKKKEAVMKPRKDTDMSFILISDPTILMETALSRRDTPAHSKEYTGGKKKA